MRTHQPWSYGRDTGALNKFWLAEIQPERRLRQQFWNNLCIKLNYIDLILHSFGKANSKDSVEIWPAKYEPCAVDTVLATIFLPASLVRCNLWCTSYLETPEAKKNASGPRGKKERRRISFLPLVRWKRLRKSKNAANTWVVQIIWIHHCLFSQLRGMIENICGPNLCQTASQNRTMKKHYVRNALRRYQKHDLKHDWKAVHTWSSCISVTGFQPYDFLGLTWIAASNTLSDWKHHVPEKIVALMFAIKWRVWNGVNSGSPSFSAVFPALSAVFPPFSAVAFLLCFAFFCVLFWLMRLLERLCATLHSLLLTSHEMQENPACKQKQ